MDHARGLFVCLVSVLLGFGLLMVHSASITSRPTEFEQVYLLRHAVFVLLAVLAGGLCAVLPARFWLRAAPALFLATVALLVLVLIPAIGTRVNGAQRWLRYGTLSLQPSELAKVTLVLITSRLIHVHRQRLRCWLAGTVPLLLPTAIVVPLVIRQPDLGTALFLSATTGMALFIGGWPARNFVTIGLVTVPLASYAVVLKPYQLKRITGFIATWTNLSEAPYQLKQSLVTLGAGGLTGIGLGRGWQKLSFLPEANTDFVFAVVGEELGLVGTLGLIALWTMLYLTGLRLLRPLPRTSFAYVAAFTLLTQLTLQAIVNVGVVTAMVPPKGISHPLLSYGGSSLIISVVALGIVLSLAQADPQTDSDVLRTE